LFSVS